MTRVHRPQTLDDALRLLGDAPDLVIVAGATDVYPARTLRAGWGALCHGDALDISAIAGLRGIEDRGDHWWLGAMTTWSDISRAELPPLFDGLKAAAREIGGVQIQNRGTIGGNIMTASPAGDSLPCLLALDAEIECVGGVRFTVPLPQFVTGYRQTALGAGEILTGVRVPKQPGRSAFLKLGARRYLVISIAMVSGVFEVASDGCIEHAKIAVGACSAVPQRLTELEAALRGRRAGADLAHHVVTPEHFAALTPIDDARGSGAYRLAAAETLVRDLIAALTRDDMRRQAS